MSQFLSVAQWLTSEIGKITRTPAPEFMGSDNASGEALKQREIGLLGKVRRFTVKAGNAWEDTIETAYRVQAAYGVVQPPVYQRFYARFVDPEIRNDTVTVDNALKVADIAGEKEVLNIIGPIYGWDEARKQEILQEKRGEKAATLQAALDAMRRPGSQPPDQPQGNPIQIMTQAMNRAAGG